MEVKYGGTKRNRTFRCASSRKRDRDEIPPAERRDRISRG